LSLELHAAYLHLGDFYDSPKEQAASITTNPTAAAAVSGRPRDPWTTFLAFKWLMF
jgi:hypothetical protein